MVFYKFEIEKILSLMFLIPAYTRERQNFAGQTMLLPQYETAGGNQVHQSLLELGQSLQSLLGSKSDLTFDWNESVKTTAPDRSVRSDEPGTRPHENQGNESREYWEKVIKGLEGKLLTLKSQCEAVQGERKNILNKRLDLKGNIRIFCRMRPFLPNDRRPSLGPILIPETATVHIFKTGQRKNFQLDRVFLPSSSQDEIFSEIEPLTRLAMQGQNVCIFSYGQTGSGKTFTMEGTKAYPGIVPRALQQVFFEASLDVVATFSVTISMLEIYRGLLRDLLVNRGKTPWSGASSALSIQMGANGFVEIENLTQVKIKSPSEAVHLYEKGVRLRSTSSTSSNETSSRSHCLLRIMVEKNHSKSGQKTVSKLWLIDLGGSERLLKTKAQGQTLEEGKAINMSLSALGDVISALHRKKHHVPYRNSKLTQLLQDSLGWNSKTLMLVHVSPKEEDLGETICSLGFASRARSIHLRDELSEEAVQKREVAISELLKVSKNLDEKIQNLRAQIKVLEQLIQDTKHLTTENTQHEEEITHPSYIEDGPRGNSSKAIGIREGKHNVSSTPRFMNPTLSSCYKRRLSFDNLYSAGPNFKIRRKGYSLSCLTDVDMKEVEIDSSQSRRVNSEDRRKSEGKQQSKPKLSASSAILFEEVTLDSTVSKISSRARILKRIELNNGFWR